MAITEKRELLCVLTEDEIQTRKDRHYEVSRTIAVLGEEKSAWLSAFRAKLKPHKDEEGELRTQIDNRGEMRNVECEWRDSLVNGVQELVRLDTLEVVDTLSDDPEDDAPEGQPSLFAGKRPPLPDQRCTGITADGEAFAITVLQADAAEMTIAVDPGEPPAALLEIDGRNVHIVKVLRGKACEVCGIVAPHHRPECAEMKADGEDEAPDSYDRNDAAAVAAKIAEGGKPDDEPLTRERPASRKVTPKRTAKANGATKETH